MNMKVIEMEGVDWVPTALARQMLGLTRQRVYQLVKCGRLSGRRYGGALLISKHSIEERIVWLKHQEEMYGDIR